ncbi:hypothetical protein ACB092_07G064200 [Castanea dentata]
MFQTMFSLKEMPTSLTTLFSAYASITAFVMLVRSMVNELVPPGFRSYLFSIFQHYFFTQSSQLTLFIEENCGIGTNQIYEAATIYLRTKISDSTERLKVSKTIRQKKSTIDVVTGEEITDCFENIKLKWKFSEKGENRHDRQKFIELSFDKKFKNVVLDSYLPYVITTSETIKEEEKEVRLYSRDCRGCDDERYSGWGSINLEHPATFEKLAMDPEVKKMIKDDLDRFVRRKELYKKVGKAWKRGYLLYGPPGTGKSSLIAAMANYLKFNIYDLNLSDIYSDSELRRILLSTCNRSILVIEDIDCSAELEDRGEEDNSRNSSSKFTLSGLLNIIDGLWSSCGDERIIVFTTNHKDRLDPALLRPGRMDMHLHMSYCTMDGFKLLASNYLGINGDHRLFKEIEGLLENAEVTPAEIAEELLKSDGNDVALEGLVKFLEQKRLEDAKSEV